ncbi:hypothetical protein CMV_018327 [Castanea mollissima]|uniref:beta-N-acetylhexosaminidase n=1 Tax=Castanea mollissima TaxID=60419 RepID=A0A8J4QPM1_9ROSI|nr:hypothetical protein CMV_018327 [Castanea mollissima]
MEAAQADLGNNVLKDGTGVTVSSINGRPTRDFKFEVTPANLALRVTISIGGKRLVSWLNHSSTNKPSTSGPVLASGLVKDLSQKNLVSGPNLLTGHVRAQVADPRGKAQNGISCYRGVGAKFLHNQSVREVGECSKPPMESPALSVMPVGAPAGIPPASIPASSSELLASNPAREMGAPVTETSPELRCSSAAVFFDSGKAVLPLETISEAEDSHDPAVSSPSVVLEAPFLLEAAPILDQVPWVIQNRFSPLAVLGNGVDEDFVEGEDQEAHTGSWAEAYPDIVTCANMFWWPAGSKREDRLASEPGTGHLNPLNPKTYQVLKRVISDVATLFPEPFYHAGADEIIPGCWRADPAIQSFLSNGGTLSQLLEIFVNSTFPYIVSLNRTVVYWEDVILDGNIKVIVSSSDFYYLDCGHGDFLGNDSQYDQQTSDNSGNGGSWCGPFKTWQTIYNYDITYGLSEEEANLVLGGEVALWSEQADPAVLDARIWPRTSAMAETLWSGNRDETGKKRYAEATDRLNEWRCRMVQRGIGAEPIQPLWCIRNPGMCNTIKHADICQPSPLSFCFHSKHSSILIITFLVLAIAQVNNNISVGSTLFSTDNDSTWTPPSGYFAFGFHWLPSEQDQFLLAIWFVKIPD